MGKLNLEQKLQFESELVRNESMLILNEFEAFDDFDLDFYSADDPKAFNENT